MNQLKRAIALPLSSCLVLFGMQACNAQPPVTPQEKMEKTEASRKLELSLKTDKSTYSPADSVKITFSVKNKGSEEVRLSFSDGQKFDLELRKGKDMKSEKLWQLARGRMSIMMITYAKIAPGKLLTFSETFKPGADGGDGKPLPTLEPGLYSLTGVLRTIGKTPRLTKTITFKVH